MEKGADEGLAETVSEDHLMREFHKRWFVNGGRTDVNVYGSCADVLTQLVAPNRRAILLPNLDFEEG